MKVKLIALTQPIEFNSPEELIAYCARVSNPSNQENFDTASKLLRYCIRKKHWSIFEQVDATFEIETTRDIGRQILRHKFQAQEFSQRYAEVDTDNFEIREARLQDIKNRQNSIQTDDSELQDHWDIWQRKVAGIASNAYQWALKNGIAKEQARAVLPEGMTPSRMYMKGSLRNWIHYVDVRTDPATQKEHRLIAEEVKIQLQKPFTFLREYWDENLQSPDQK